MAEKSIQVYSQKNPKSLLFNTILKLYKKLAQQFPKKKRLITILPTNHLPLELESEILLRLPVKDLVRYRCVSKCWNNEIKSPYFIELHTRRNYSAPSSEFLIISKQHKLFSLKFHDSYNNNSGGVYKGVAFRGIASNLLFATLVIGSCNGLICFKKIGFDNDRKLLRILVLNPTTGKHLFIPPLLVEKKGPPHHYGINMLGFGYDRISDDYKILCTIYSNPVGISSTCEYEYNVYSMKANSWKIIQPHLKVVNTTCNIPMVLSNGSLHCIAYIDDAALNARGIYGFDLQTEEFHEVPQPNYDDNDDDNDLAYGRYMLADLRGCLHFAKYVAPLTNIAPMCKLECYMTVWVMKEYGLKQSWTKVIDRISVKELVQASGLESVDCNTGYHSHASHMPSPLAYTEDGLEILIGLGSPQFISGFARCDVRSGELRKFHVRDLGLTCEVMPWMCSLVQNPFSS